MDSNPANASTRVDIDDDLTIFYGVEIGTVAECLQPCSEVGREEVALLQADDTAQAPCIVSREEATVDAQAVIRT